MGKAMLRVWFWYGQIVCLRASPAQLPAHRLAWHVAFFWYTCAHVVALLAVPAQQLILNYVVELTVLLGSSALLLNAFSVPSRWGQTTQALLGGSALLNVLSIPLASAASLSPNAPLWGIVLLGLISWWMLFVAHVLGHALQWRPVRSAPLALGYVMAIILLQNWITRIMSGVP